MDTFVCSHSEQTISPRSTTARINKETMKIVTRFVLGHFLFDVETFSEDENLGTHRATHRLLLDTTYLRQ
ncbi:unnamed protein product [Sphenostylis stenocarpa]|uniref:Uncharacterized protein n=1 Tax=Sphenostylis stenocarpa TaxID=92480 RepID=A0AA86SWL6_9FABA|nr:unnamed protein product [Sphenostylis stenocarpa]